MASIGIRPDVEFAPPPREYDSLPPAFESPDGEAAYMSAYDAAMRDWPVPYEEVNLTSRYGRTHLVVSGPLDAPPLVLLHGYAAGLTMWAPNVADLSVEHRVYALDVIGQPGKSRPARPLATREDFVAWLTTVLDSLGVERADFAGMSYGGWLTLNFAIARPERVRRIALLSPSGGLEPLVDEFYRRSAEMSTGTRATAEAFIRWLAFADTPADPDLRARYDSLIEQFYLGARHFRKEYMMAAPPPETFTDEELHSVHAPTLLLIGDRDPIYDPAAALARARRLIPNIDGELVAGSSHMMSLGKAEYVDLHLLAFLRDGRAAAAAPKERDS